MDSIRMVSTGRHVYGGRSLVPGNPFVAHSELDAEELRLLGFARNEEALVVKPMEPQPAPVASTRVLDAAKPKRAYRRRDISSSK